MTEMIYIKPAEGLKVLNPASGKHLPAEGARVILTPYWRRRLRDEDVTKTRRPRATKSQER